MPKEFTYQIKIRERHLDTFGHVNNATYLELFEEARWDIINQNDYGLKYIQESRQGPIILDIKIRFKREICVNQIINIKSTILEYRKSLGKLRQQMINEDGTNCCEAIFRLGLFDLDKRTLIRPTDKWLKALGVEI